ncbi:MAG: hypothetical protein U1F57_02065 [bacterium]
MDKVIFDTFVPDSACFEPPPSNPSQQDKCTVSATFHLRDNPTASQPDVVFQRDKDKFIYYPGKASIAVLQGLNFNEKEASFQSGLNFEVFLHGWFKNNYPNFKSAVNYKGPDLMPLSVKLAHFITAGNIEDPDGPQRKALSSIMRDLYQSDSDGKTWFRTMFESLSDEKKNLKLTPLPMRPRVQWLLEQVKFYEEISKAIDAVKGDDNAPFRSRLYQITNDILDHLNTGEKSFKDVKADLDKIAAEAYGSKAATKDLKDLFAFFSKKMDALAKQSFYTTNKDAEKRLLTFNGYIKQAVTDSRSELLSLPEGQAFQKSIEYRAEGAAQSGLLGNRVKDEASGAGITPTWVNENADEVIKAMVPHFTLDTKNSLPRVHIDVKSMKDSVDALIKKHPSQEKEYHVVALAVLRYLVGDSLSTPMVEGWYKDGFKSMEVDLNQEEGQQMFAFRDQLTKKTYKPSTFVNIGLPIIEGGVLATGIGLSAYGFATAKDQKSPFTIAGMSAVGTGVGSLTCHFAWKNKNQVWTDMLCGVVGGLAFGLTTGFALKNPPGSTMPPGPPIDGRNPVTPWGP